MAALAPRLFRSLCEVLGIPEHAHDPRFDGNSQRLKHRDALHDALQARFLGATSDAWEALLLAQGVPCARINTVDQVVCDPQVEALGMLREYRHPDIEDHRLVDHPVSYNGTRSFRHDGAPGLGADTESVLRGLGYDAAAIDAMVSSGAVQVAARAPSSGRDDDDA